jgi:hypothetical protein
MGFMSSTPGPRTRFGGFLSDFWLPGICVSLVAPVLRGPWLLLAGVILVILVCNELVYLVFRRCTNRSTLLVDAICSVPLFGLATLAGSLLFQFALHLSILQDISFTSAVVFAISAIVQLRVGFRSALLRLNLSRPSLERVIFPVTLAIGAFAFYLGAYLVLTYSQPPSVFLFGDQTLYLANIRGFVAGGVDIQNSGMSFLSASSYVYVSSANSMSSWFFVLFGGVSNPIVFYAVLTAFNSALFVLAGFFLTLDKIAMRVRVLALVFVVAGFSVIGLVWIWLGSVGLPNSLAAPAFFQGTPIPRAQGGFVYLEGAESELLYKGAWHGLGYVSLLLAFWHFGRAPAGLKSLPVLAFVASCFAAYLELGVLTLLALLVSHFLIRLRIRNFETVAAAGALIPILFRAADSTITIPFIGFSLLPKGITDVVASAWALGVFTIGFIVLLAIPSVRQRLLDRVLQPAAIAAIFLISFSLSMLLLFSTQLYNGVSDDYIWGMAASLGLLILTGVVLADRSSRPHPQRPPQAPVSRGKRFRIIVDSLEQMAREDRVVILMICLLLLLPTLFYMVQPTSEFPSNANPQKNQALLVPQSAIEMSQWMTANLPQHSISMVPPAMWYMAALTGHTILAETYGQSSLTSPAIQFEQRFYQTGVAVNFTSSDALQGWTNSTNPPTGTFFITRNMTFEGEPVLQVNRQQYSAVAYQTGIPLVNCLLNFSLLVPEFQPQPYDTLGVTLRLDTGIQLQFQSNWNASIYSNDYVDYLPVDQGVWSSDSVNVTAFARNLPQVNVLDDYVTQVSLGGGNTPTVYWAGVALGYPSLPQSSISGYFSSFGVGYVLLDGSTPNTYVTELLVHGVLTPLHSDGSLTLYQVEAPY